MDGSQHSPRCDVAGLMAFVATARFGGVARAAQRLGRTQPSISARIGRLEQAWGTRLFRRAARGMQLTPEGAALLPQAEALLDGMQRLDQQAGLPFRRDAELRVGAGDALGRELLPAALGGLASSARQSRQPTELDIYIREGPGRALLDALRDGEIDVALVVDGVAGAGDAVDLAPLLATEVDLLAPKASSL